MNLYTDYAHLIKAGLVKAKANEDTGLTIIKYARKVFYDSLWNSDPLLVEARGHAFYSDTGEQAVFPPTKVFNYLENGAGAELDDHTELCVVRKVNGFLACATLINGKLEIVSTTGSLDSDYVALARKHLDKLDWAFIDNPVRLPFYQQHMTFHFEIVDESDPHIVREIPGAYLIGCKMADGREAHERQLDDMAMDIGAYRPGWHYTFMPALTQLVKDCKHEGFMVKDAHNNEKTLFKWKSPHYLTKKFLMRMSANKTREMFEESQQFKQKLDEEFYEIYEAILKEHTYHSWVALTEGERRTYIEEYFK